MGLVSVRPEDRSTNDVYRFMTDTIQPRPIALVSTIDGQGRTNLAPFSFFNGIGSNPPLLVFSPALKPPDGQKKDTLLNIEETREFVVGVVTEDTVERANVSSIEFEHGVSEFAEAGFTPFPSHVVKPPCILESPINFECTLVQVVRTGDDVGAGNLVIGRIVMVHADEAVLESGQWRARPEALKLVGRMGGPTYVRTTDRFDLARPKRRTP